MAPVGVGLNDDSLNRHPLLLCQFQKLVDGFAELVKAEVVFVYVGFHNSASWGALGTRARYAVDARGAVDLDPRTVALGTGVVHARAPM